MENNIQFDSYCSCHHHNTDNNSYGAIQYSFRKGKCFNFTETNEKISRIVYGKKL